MNNEDDIKAFQLKLLFYRKLRNLTQASLSEKANISPRNYQRIEAGEIVPRLDTICQIASALNVEIYNLVSTQDFSSLKNIYTKLKKIKNTDETKEKSFKGLKDKIHKINEEFSNEMQNINKFYNKHDILTNHPNGNGNTFFATIDGMKFSTQFKKEYKIKKELVNYNIFLNPEHAASCILDLSDKLQTTFDMLSTLKINNKHYLFYKVYSFIGNSKKGPTIYGHMLNITDYKNLVFSNLTNYY
jgi:transcriptional regulator with XRE-family HTH domain